MLQTIREHTQGWIAGTIISLIILSFALWGIHSYFIGGGNDNVIAEVNGTEITKEQLGAAYERLRRQMQSQYGTANASADRNEGALRDRALQVLIEAEILKQASLSEGFVVSNRQLDRYLQNVPDFQINGQFSVERFQEVLSMMMFSTSEFLDLMKTSLLIDQPKLGIFLTSFSLPDETKQMISLVNQERNIDYVHIPVNYFLSQPLSIPSEKLKAYYDQNKAMFMTPEQVSVEYVELSQKHISQGIKPTDEMLSDYYKENINSYTQPMSWQLVGIELPFSPNMTEEDMKKVEAKAEQIKEALAKNQDAAALSKQYSASLIAKDWMTLQQVPQLLQKTVEGFTKAGQVSDPIRTSRGLVIVKVDGIREAKVETFEEVKSKVKEAYIRQQSEEKFAELRERLADLAYEHPDSLQPLASSLGLSVKTTELFSKNTAGNDISKHRKVRDAAFSNDVLAMQNNSDVIQVDPGTMIVLRIKNHQPSSLMPFEKVKNEIDVRLKKQEAEVLTAKLAKDLQAKLESRADSQALLATYKLSWTNVGFTGRYSTKVDSSILNTAFTLPDPVGTNKKIVYGLAKLPDGGYAVIALKAVKNGSTSDAKQTSVFAEQLQNSDALLEYELYKQSQIKKANVVVGS